MNAKPVFTHHRTIISPAKENTTVAGMITALKLRGATGTELIRGAASARGWKSVAGYVKLAGGSSPTVTLQPYEVVQYRDGGEGDIVDDLVILGSAIGPLSNGGTFSLTVNGAHVFIAVDAATGTPTSGQIHLTGEERDLEALRVG